MNIGIVLCRDREILYKLTLERNQMSYHFVNLFFFSLFWWRGGCNNFPGQKDGSAVWNIIYF